MFNMYSIIYQYTHTNLRIYFAACAKPIRNVHTDIFRFKILYVFRFLLGIFQAWTLEQNIDGYATLDGPNEELEPRWASDELDIRVFADANNNRSL